MKDDKENYFLDSPHGNAEKSCSATSQLLFDKFEKQCSKSPDNIALYFNDKSLSYQELLIKAKNLAYHLQCLRVQKNTLVAILLPKSDHQIFATLGILMSGAAYMPINISESSERQQALLERGEVNVVITLNDIVEKCSWLNNYATVAIDKVLENTNLKQNILLKTINTPHDLAYVVFTSGSTGTPKGVMINHFNAINTINDINERFNVNDKDRVLALSALDFDLSVYDIFGPLSVGGALVIPDEKQSTEPNEWLSLVKAYNITIWNSVPGFMDMTVRHLQLESHAKKATPSYETLRLVMLSGDWIRVQLPNEIKQFFSLAKIMSLGGATETSIWSIAYPIDQVNPSWKSIPYGKPLKNQFFHILDNNQIELPDGEEGELYIGGYGVGRGYWRDSENTHYHFIHHPKLGYLYRTGDKGRLKSDGNIEFLGRVGEKIKLRGFRLDLKAIEKSIEVLPEIRRSFVKIIRTHQNTESLVAFVEPENLIDYLLNSYKLYKALVNKHLHYWQSIYDELFKTSKEPEDPAFNTLGWISSYSRKCIPEYQMREWLNNTLSRIYSLKLKCVLEVGVGSCMLLANIAPKTEIYDATDNSSVILSYAKKYFSKDGYEHVNYYCGELEKLPTHRRYDTVILNSVAQYFPDILYLTKTLDQLVDKTEKEGHVFLGDIYHHSYIEDFHVSVQLQHQPSYLQINKFDTLVARLIKKEGELFIHPQFFLDFAKRNRRISSVDIQLKSGLSHNELNGFRYDVVLGIEQVSPVLTNPVIKTIEELPTLDLIKDYLCTDEPDSLVVKNIPNLRVIGLSNYLTIRGRNKKTISLLREVIYQHNQYAIDPHYCYKLGKELGYHVSCTWSEKKYNFDVSFYHNDNPLKHYISEYESKKESYYFNYSNMPLLRQFYTNIEKKLQRHIKQKLANYMQPHEFIFLDKVPFTYNGKLDGQVLEQLFLTLSQTDENRSLIAMDKTEKKLLVIYKKILKLCNVDINKGFIQLGGDSLMMLEATHMVKKEFDISITISQLIAHPSIRELSLFLNAKISSAKREELV